MIAELTKGDEERIAKIQAILLGNRDAAVFVAMVFRIFHAWDDLIDKDAPVPDAEINMAFYLAMVQVPRNPFYRANFAELSPIVSQAIANWMYATQAEREAPSEATFIVRSSYVDILLKSAEIVGGLNYAVGAQHAIREWFHAEGYAQYLTNLQNEAAVRGQGAAQ